MSSDDQTQQDCIQSSADQLARLTLGLHPDYKAAVKCWEKQKSNLRIFNDNIHRFPEINAEARLSRNTCSDVISLPFNHSTPAQGSLYVTGSNRPSWKICVGSLLDLKNDKNQIWQETLRMDDLLQFKRDEINEAARVLEQTVTAVPKLVADTWQTYNSACARVPAMQYFRNNQQTWIDGETEIQRSHRTPMAFREEFVKGLSVDVDGIRETICQGIYDKDIDVWIGEDPGSFAGERVDLGLDRASLSSYIPLVNEKIDLVGSNNRGSTAPGYRLNLGWTDKSLKHSQSEVQKAEAFDLSFKADSDILKATEAGERSVGTGLEGKIYTDAIQSIIKLWSHDTSETLLPLNRLDITFSNSEEMQTDFKNSIREGIDNMISARYMAGVCGLEEIKNTYLRPRKDIAANNDVDIILDWINPDSRFSEQVPAPEPISIRRIVKEHYPSFDSNIPLDNDEDEVTF